MICKTKWQQALVALGFLFFICSARAMEDRRGKELKQNLIFNVPEAPAKVKIDYAKLSLPQILNFSGAKNEYNVYLSRLQILGNLFLCTMNH